MNQLRVFIGFDEREADAAHVARKTLREVTNGEIEPEFLCLPKLHDQGLLTRPTDHRGGRDYDMHSNAPASTRFAISRFLTPILCQQGFALFVDADVVFHEDPRQMLREIQSKHAVSVVKHAPVATAAVKMGDQTQLSYERKLWSSVMLFNCDHIANRRLSLRDVNERPGRDLHRLYWLNDHEIGDLHPRWNWLVNVNPDPPVDEIDLYGIAHFTLGGPFTPGWTGAKHDDIWKAAAE